MERRLISLHIPSLRKLLGCINKELYEKKESVANHEGWRFLAIYVRLVEPDWLQRQIPGVSRLIKTSSKDIQRFKYKLFKTDS